MESINAVVDRVKQQCESLFSAVAYKIWIAPIKPVSMDGDHIVLYVENQYHKKTLCDHYIATIKEVFEATLGHPVNITIATQDDIDQYPLQTQNTVPSNEKTAEQPAAPPPEARPAEDKKAPQTEAPIVPKNNAYLESLRRAHYEYTFDTFIVGSSNQLAYAACEAVAKKRNGQYNPLFIYGPSGLGKTHLLSAIQHEILSNNPEVNVAYISSETFTNDLISAIGSKTTEAFHKKYRQVDVLLMDDVQFISGKESTQEEFFHTFNELYQVKKQIVLTSDRPPREIKTLEDRLKNRFESGVIVDVSPPDYETRIAIIRRKAELLDMDIPSDVAEFIAERVKSNIRQLEGVVKKIHAYQQFAGLQPSLRVAQDSIREILSDSEPAEVTVDRIIEEVAKTYSISKEDIRSNKRSAAISSARQIAMYVTREITGMSLQAIGGEFGGRDHATIVYSIAQVEKKMKKDTHQGEVISDIIKNIRDR